MLLSRINEIREDLRRGASATDAVNESLRRIASEDGNRLPVLCRTPTEVDAADHIEWTELIDSCRHLHMTDSHLRDIQKIHELYLSNAGERYGLFADLGGMPPTVAMSIAIANLDKAEGEWSQAMQNVRTVRFIRKALLDLNDETLMKQLQHAVSHARPVHAFIRREDSDAVLELAEDLDQRLRAGEELPLAGVPIAVKDVFALGRTTAASKILSDYIAPREYVATSVRNLLLAGAISMGKTNLDEFALGSSGTSTAYWPAARNPYDRACVPGGSSAGSAAAVAAGMVIGAIGSDTAGSIRVPASYCGVVGVKPTYGLVSRFGLIALASSLDCVGPIARTVTDAAILLGHMIGVERDENDQTMRRSKFDPTVFARPLLEDDSWLMSLRGMTVGIPIEYFLAYDLDDRDDIDRLLAGSFDFDRLRERRTDSRRPASQVGQFVSWMERSRNADKLTIEQGAKLWNEFETHEKLQDEPRDKLRSCLSLWDKLADLISWLHHDLGVEFQFVSMRHTWLSIPVYFVISRQELASNLHRYDGLKYGRPPGHLAENFEMAAALNRATCFGAQPKQRILMGIHVLQSDNKDRLLMCAKRARKLIRRDFEEAFANVDLLLSPTVNTFAPIFGGFGNTVTEQFTDEFSVPANHAGVPAISVPLYREHDGWQSAQVIAKEFDEGRMFLLAGAIEEWRSRQGGL
jgi:aspartyl-tRNA(Asn)/glutamyl-tRNA(Gln) amidotransferase subunit A